MIKVTKFQDQYNGFRAIEEKPGPSNLNRFSMITFVKLTQF